MNIKKAKSIEDLHPLTIIGRQYSDDFVITQIESDNEFIHELQLEDNSGKTFDELVQFYNFFPEQFGIGKTLNDAFMDFKKKNKK